MELLFKVLSSEVVSRFDLQMCYNYIAANYDMKDDMVAMVLRILEYKGRRF